VALALALGLPHLVVGASGQTPAYDLCIEQSPTAAGTVTPNSGTHRFSADSVVVLSAEPQPGYQFAYWIGDVADPAAQRTTVRVNSPKVVVAVFRPAEDGLDEIRLGGGGGGGLTATSIELGSPGWSTGGGGKAETRTVIVPVVQTPEPATIILLGLGTLVLRRRRNVKR
jgi:hypothetical protein